MVIYLLLCSNAACILPEKAVQQQDLRGEKITCEIKLIWKRKVQLSPTRLAQTGSNQKIIKPPPQNIYFINSFTNVCAWNSAPLGHSITSEHLPWRDCFVEHVKKPLSISQVNLVSNILT